MKDNDNCAKKQQKYNIIQLEITNCWSVVSQTADRMCSLM